MQVVCGNCQLSFQAPEGAAGLMCPICRSPLRPAQAAGDAAANQNLVEWSGGTLDDLVAYLSGPAAAVRIEVLPATGDTAVGEVHMLAGGISETLYAGKSTDDALDKLRGVNNPRFRLETRLPNPVDGDLTSPGPESGTLDSRPLAHLMRYCEQYVITCGIEVWRGSETARVEYRKGEISGVAVGGIDAPERLAEVMQWASGNYRLIMPKLTMPESVPKAPAVKPAAPAPAPAAAAPAPAAAPPARPPATPPAARLPATPPTARPAAPAPQPAPAPARAPAPAAAAASTHATRTIFGMPALDLAGLKANEAAAAVARQTATPVGQAPAAAAPVTPPSSSPAPIPAAISASGTTQGASSGSATKTIFGVPAPKIPEKEKPAERPVDTKPSEKVIVEKMHEESPKAARPAPVPESPPQRAERKTGARKTVVPAPAIIPPAASAGAPPETAAPLAAAAAAETSETSRTTHQGYGGQSAAAEVVPARVPAAEDRTSPVRAVTAKKSRGIPVWTYVGVGFLFGLALLGIYQLVGVLAH
jgi:hypothetical protein